MDAEHIEVPCDHAPLKYDTQTAAGAFLVWERDNPEAWMQTEDFVGVIE